MRRKGLQAMIKRISPWAAMTGTVIFTLAFLVNGLLQPAYDPMKMYVSELSLGPQGWIQIVNFMLWVAAFLFLLSESKVFQRGKSKPFRIYPIHDHRHLLFPVRLICDRSGFYV